MKRTVSTFHKLRSLKCNIDTIDELHHYLRIAMEIELATIPAYLCALYSIKPGTNTAAADVIQSVVMEEMLHLTLAANVLNATGGASMVNDPEFVPVYPTELPDSDIHTPTGSFKVPLQRFCPEAIDTFLRIEQPEPRDAPAPSVDGWTTIGQFYAGLAQGLDNLCQKLGAEAVFTGTRDHQVGPEEYYGGAGNIIVVTDPDPEIALQNALLAFEEIVEQGEGVDHGVFDDDTLPGKHGAEVPVPAHFFRFQEIKLGRHYVPGDKPGAPTGKALHVDWDAVFNMRENPSMDQYPEGSEIHAGLNAFNEVYTNLLNVLQVSFSGQPGRLREGVGLMYDLKYKAEALMKTPSGDGDTTVGPSFESVA